MNNLGGKLVIVGIAVVSIAGSVLAVWYHWQLGRQALAYWGPDAAVLIRSAPQVELLRLAPAKEAEEGQSVERLRIGGERFDVVCRSDITEARGLIHARNAFLEDASFDFGATPGDSPANWQWALRFAGEGSEALVAIDADGGLARLIDGPGQSDVSIAPIARGIRTFLAEQVGCQDGGL